MIENATLVADTASGGVLILLPRTGMDFSVQTDVSVRDGKLLLSQRGKCFVAAVLESPSDAEMLIGNPDILVTEVDENGLANHDNVRGPTT